MQRIEKPRKWVVSIPQALDVAVRLHLAQAGLRKGDLSRFVVEALEAHLLSDSLKQARGHNHGVGTEILTRAIAAAVREVRAESFGARP